jgi:anti-sigma B factor antagonist
LPQKHLPANDLFDIDVEQRDGVVVVKPRGELDMVTAPHLRDILRDLRQKQASVLLDLGELTFLDSTGLRLIWDADAASREDGLTLTLTVASPDIMRVFELTGLNRRLNFANGN